MEIDKTVYRLNVFRLISVISKRRYFGPIIVTLKKNNRSQSLKLYSHDKIITFNTVQFKL